MKIFYFPHTLSTALMAIDTEQANNTLAASGRFSVLQTSLSAYVDMLEFYLLTFCFLVQVSISDLQPKM
jgi:hypothetical protein